MSSQMNTVSLRRVVITGMGAVSPAGLGVETLWSKITSGESCLSLFPEERREALGVKRNPDVLLLLSSTQFLLLMKQ